MDIIRHDDGSLTVPVEAARHTGEDDPDSPENPDTPVEPGATTMVLRPGEGGYIEALGIWDLQQNPDRGVAVSTVSGREQAMAVVHAVDDDPQHVAEAVEALEDPESSAEALRHVLVGGTPSVHAFATEVAAAEGGDELPPHKATKIIGQVLAEIDSRPS
jgi:hypothetical protein